MGRSFNTGNFAAAGQGTSGQVLTSQGTGSSPVWANAATTPDFLLMSQGVI